MRFLLQKGKGHAKTLVNTNKLRSTITHGRKGVNGSTKNIFRAYHRVKLLANFGKVLKK